MDNVDTSEFRPVSIYRKGIEDPYQVKMPAEAAQNFFSSFHRDSSERFTCGVSDASGELYAESFNMDDISSIRIPADLIDTD